MLELAKPLARRPISELTAAEILDVLRNPVPKRIIWPFGKSSGILSRRRSLTLHGTDGSPLCSNCRINCTGR